MPRVPISTNARYSFPALARSSNFDSIVLGDSSARLLRPVDLDLGFGAHFANLAMNSATAYEQSQLLRVFLHHHPQPRIVIIAIDNAWCSDSRLKFTPRPFPAWMYRDDRWPGYRDMLTPYAVQEAANQLAVMMGWKKRRYGLDGYTSFVPPDTQYDPARRDQAFRRWPALDREPAPDQPVPLPSLPILDQMLASIPPKTRKILYFTPYHEDQLGAPGSVTAWRWSGCKQATAAAARLHGAELLDFQVRSPITSNRDNFWDPVHYRQAIAETIVQALVTGVSPDADILVSPSSPSRTAPY